jgi:CHAD domain-containing protein
MNAGFPSSVFAALAAAQADQVVRSLAQRRNRHAAIHSTRKAIRRLRSILALCRQGLGQRVKVIDKGLKQLGASLSDLRDAHVAVTTASKLATGAERESWLVLASRLAARRDALLAQTLAGDHDFAARRKQLDELIVAVAALPWHCLKEKHLDEGIARSAHRLAKAERAARREPGAVKNHRWRRRLRRLRMQYQAMSEARKCAPSWVVPARLHRHTSLHRLARLSDRLGWLQDLQRLEAFLKETDATLPWALMRRHLRSEIKRVMLAAPSDGPVPCGAILEQPA